MSTVSVPREAAKRVEREESHEAAIDPSQHVPWRGRTLLGVFLIALGLILVYLLVALWPAVQAATTSTTEEKTVNWFGWTFSLTPDSALLVLVLLVSAIGSSVHSATSFVDYSGNRRLERSWIWWYLLRVSVGTSLALLFYFAVRGGFFQGNADSADINPYGIAAVAGLVGLFSKQATDKLREIFDTAFRVAPGYGDDARSGSIVNPVPKLEASEPERLTAGAVELTLVGSGFVEGSTVRVARAGGPELQREVTVVGPQRLRVTLDAEDVATPGWLVFTVVNPEPGGGTSRSLRVWVDAAGEDGGGGTASDPRPEPPADA